MPYQLEQMRVSTAISFRLELLDALRVLTCGPFEATWIFFCPSMVKVILIGGKICRLCRRLGGFLLLHLLRGICNGWSHPEQPSWPVPLSERIR